MTSQALIEARQYEELKEKEIPSEERPLFHLAARTGWMNDPNGFSEYNGIYHLFYQYYPYKPKWGPMHWGHAVSRDFVKWEYRPAVLAPDTDADSAGCFSGSAVTLDDGRHMIMYTGVIAGQEPGDKDMQVQCLAFGDGEEYVKYERNPILCAENLPGHLSSFDFRDPKINREADGTYSCVVCGCTEDRDARILYFTSSNGTDWKFRSVLAENNGRFGTVWECPDFFELDGKAVLLCSPMEMLKDEKYYSGNGTMCLIGEFDRENCRLVEESDSPIDCGIDFYATQTLLTDDGRRVMTAWMQNWDALQNDTTGVHWFGQMILPREITLRDGKLYQQPVREILAYRKDRIVYQNVPVKERTELVGINGRTADITVTLRAAEHGAYNEFEIRFAENNEYYSSFVYNRSQSLITVDRSLSGTRKAVVHTRSFHTAEHENELKIRMILDRCSVEFFINDGEQTASFTLYTDMKADGISFRSDGNAVIDIEKYTLSDK